MLREGGCRFWVDDDDDEEKEGGIAKAERRESLVIITSSQNSTSSPLLIPSCIRRIVSVYTYLYYNYAPTAARVWVPPIVRCRVGGAAFAA